jgi:hypothetical protein
MYLGDAIGGACNTHEKDECVGLLGELVVDGRLL